MINNMLTIIFLKGSLFFLRDIVKLQFFINTKTFEIININKFILIVRDLLLNDIIYFDIKMKFRALYNLIEN